jgi:hypothetical protein
MISIELGKAILLVQDKAKIEHGMNQIRPGEKCRMATDFDETW